MAGGRWPVAGGVLLFLSVGVVWLNGRASQKDAVAAILERTPELPSKPPTLWYDPTSTEYDFGLVLAGSDVTRSHTFAIKNVSSHPIRVRGVENKKPCCGDVAAISPTVVKPGDTIEVAVTLKIGLGEGRLDHFASLNVEAGDEPVLIRTSANAHARVSIQNGNSFDGVLNPGESRRVEYVVRSFGTEDNPPPPLDDHAIRSRLPATWVTVLSKRPTDKEGIVELRRTLSVTLPSSPDPGHRSESLGVANPGGIVVGQRRINWEVVSALVASPSGLVLAADAKPASKVVVRRRDGGPFRVTSATTQLEGVTVQVDSDSDAGPSRTLTLHLVGPVHPESRTGVIIVRTNQADQPTLEVAVYIAGQPKRGSR